MKVPSILLSYMLVMGCSNGLGQVDTDDSSGQGTAGSTRDDEAPSGEQNQPGDSPGTGNDDEGNAPDDGSPSNGQPPNSTGGTDDPSLPVPDLNPPGDEKDCSGTPVLPAPLLRLTNTEVINSIRDLFPNLPAPATQLAPESAVEGYSTLANVQSVNATSIESYDSVAAEVAGAILGQVGTYTGCDAAADTFRDCAQQFALATAEKAYRRPLDADETTRLTELFTQSADSWGASTALELSITAVLQSPQFLYRSEYAGEVAGASAALSGYELASRLSYLLWDTAPDTDLLAAAASGKLATASDVEAQARRMLDDERAHAAVSAFHYQWLRLEKVQNLRRVSEATPDFPPEMSALLLESTQKYIDQLFWEGASLHEFLTDKRAFINDALAPIYGAEAPGTDELTLVDVNPDQRSGILTQAGILAGFAHETSDSPVLRGVFILDRLLCAAPPPPPAGIPTSPDLEKANEAKTTRQKMEQGHSLDACRGCHAAIDGIGFAFSNYDAVGAWRDQENGADLDASGELVDTLDVDGEVNGALELGAKLAESRQVRACMAQQWYRYGMGLAKSQVDECALEPVLDRFTGGDMSLQELLVGLVTSDAFMRRSVEE